MKHQDSTVTVLRRLLLGLLLFGLTGTATELLLISHDEDIWQMIPIVAIALAALASIGLAGIVLHYRANMEFKLEMDPTLGGLALFWSVVRAKTPPALAPATLALLGLLGLTYAFRRRDDPPSAIR